MGTYYRKYRKITEDPINGLTLKAQYKGLYLGESGDLVAAFGATPTTQPASSGQAIVDTTQAASTQAAAAVTLVNSLRAALVTLGWIKGSA